MRFLLHGLVGAVAAWVVVWGLAFAFLVGDPRLIAEYLQWSWSGGGERVSYEQLFALIAVPFGALAGVLRQLSRVKRV